VKANVRLRRLQGGDSPETLLSSCEEKRISLLVVALMQSVSHNQNVLSSPRGWMIPREAETDDSQVSVIDTLIVSPSMTMDV